MDKTFQEFLHAPEFKEKQRHLWVDSYPRHFFERIGTQDFTSLRALRDWTRERWPDYFRRRGKEEIPQLWAIFLAWKETGDA